MSTECRSLPVRDYLDMGVTVSALQYTRSPRPAHRVIFRLRLRNAGRGSVRLLGRKWILRDRAGNTRIIEAEQLFNQQPVLTPGAVFSFSGCHSFDTVPTSMEVRFFGTDQRNDAFITPALELPVNRK